jgi:hypothetical protein
MSAEASGHRRQRTSPTWRRRVGAVDRLLDDTRAPRVRRCSACSRQLYRARREVEPDLVPHGRARPEVSSPRHG